MWNSLEASGARGGAGDIALTPLEMGTAGAGELVFRGLERPMLQWFGRRRRSAIPVKA